MIATLAGVSIYDVKTIDEGLEGEATEHELVCGSTVVQYAEKAKKRIDISFRIKKSDMDTLKSKVAKKTTYTDIYGRNYNVYFLSLSIKELPPITDFRDGGASLIILE